MNAKRILFIITLCLFYIKGYSQLAIDTLSLEDSNINNYVIKELIFSLILEDSILLLDENFTKSSYPEILKKNSETYLVTREVNSLSEMGQQTMLENRIKKSFLSKLIIRKDKNSILLGAGFDIYNTDGTFENNLVLFWVSFPQFE
jgi:hypothetical protein